jgi:hypothetical protein
MTEGYCFHSGKKMMTQTGAGIAAKKLKIHAYRCKFCSAFHITKQSNDQSKARRHREMGLVQ